MSDINKSSATKMSPAEGLMQLGLALILLVGITDAQSSPPLGTASLLFLSRLARPESHFSAASSDIAAA
jgi:hypothetical protein